MRLSSSTIFNQGAASISAQQSDLFQKMAQLQDMYETLTKNDERMSPDYQPPGAPEVPSQCMENDDCRPCYEKGQAKLNKGIALRLPTFPLAPVLRR